MASILVQRLICRADVFYITFVRELNRILGMGYLLNFRLYRCTIIVGSNPACSRCFGYLQLPASHGLHFDLGEPRFESRPSVCMGMQFSMIRYIFTEESAKAVNISASKGRNGDVIVLE